MDVVGLEEEGWLGSMEEGEGAKESMLGLGIFEEVGFKTKQNKTKQNKFLSRFDLINS